MNSSNNENSNNSEFYEEMLLRHIANKYVEAENQKIEKEMQETEDIPEVQVNLHKIYRREQKNNPKNIKNRMILYKAGSAVAVFIISMVIITATVPPVRAAALEFFIKMYDTHTDISNYNTGELATTSEGQTDNDKFAVKLNKEYGITYLPEGFSIVTESKDSMGVIRDYYNEKNDCIMYEQMTYNATISIDTENAEVSTVDINGKEAVMSIKESNQSINIIWKLDDYFINLSTIGISKEEALKVARSVQ